MSSAPLAGPLQLALSDAHTLAVTPAAGAVTLAVRDAAGNTQLSVEIVMSAQGPVLRARGVSLELAAERDIVARCENFRVEATGSLELAGARVAMNASLGGVQIQANDDVQLLGEQVLLNCERTPPLPSWVPLTTPGPAPLALESVSGDAELAALLPPGPPR